MALRNIVLGLVVFGLLAGGFAGARLSGSSGAQKTGAVLEPAGPGWGKPANFDTVAFEDGKGRRLSLADFRGRLLLVNVWATWCAPCVEEMPSLDKLQSKLGGRGFQVIALSVDRGGTSVVEAFYREMGIKHLDIYTDQSMRAMLTLAPEGLPVTVLIDSKGRLVGKTIGARDWVGKDALEMIEAMIEVEEDTRR